MGFSRREEKEEQEYLFKKGGSVLIKGIWDYNGMLILYGKVSEGLITNRMSFLLPRTNGKTMRAYPETLQYNEPDHVPYYIKWAQKGAPVILRFRKAELKPDVQVRRWQTITT